jgi:uncharacterized protein YndB with AHSA1/START domain
MNEVVVVRRVIPAPREDVFAAWLDAAAMTQWMLPGSTTHSTIELDPRVGGQFRIVMSHGDRATEHRGEYLAIEPPALLSFTWISPATDQQPTIVTIELAERDGGTELTLTHRNLPASKIEQHTTGWTDIVRKLAEGLLRASL